MDASNLAQQILTDLWEVGRVVLIGGAVAFIWSSILKRSEEASERWHFQILLILIMLGITGPFAAAVFFNMEAGNLITLMKIKPAWGILTGLVALVVFLFLAITGYMILAANRRALPLSIRETVRELPRQLYSNKIKLIVLVLSLLISSSILWLWRIAQ